MSEFGPKPDPASINFKSNGTVFEQTQFSDGGIMLGCHQPGAEVVWGANKHTKDLVKVGSPGLVIVQMGNDARFALGKGTIVELPQLDTETGQFTTQDTHRAYDISNLPEGLPDITIGAPWTLLGGDIPVDRVMVDYTSTTPGDLEKQEDMPNPFPVADRIVRQTSERMHGHS